MKRTNSKIDSEQRELKNISNEERAGQARAQKAERKQRHRAKNQRPHQWVETDEWTDSEWERLC